MRKKLNTVKTFKMRFVSEGSIGNDNCDNLQEERNRFAHVFSSKAANQRLITKFRPIKK